MFSVAKWRDSRLERVLMIVQYYPEKEEKVENEEREERKTRRTIDKRLAL